MTAELRRIGAALTPRERRAMQLLAAGHSRDEIGREMYLSRSVVRNVLAAAYARLGAVNAPHAVALAIAAGALGPPARDRGEVSA